MGKFKLDTEYVVWGSNGELGSRRHVYPSSVVDAPPPKKRSHIAQKPELVYEHLLSIAPANAVVLDPFTGSGTALAAARTAGHRGIGIELDKRYCRVAADRMGRPSREGSAGVGRRPSG